MKTSTDKHRIKIFDTTLRDGEQSPGCSMNLEEKLRVARALEDLRVDIIEAGFPIASNGDFEAVREVAKAVKEAQVAGLARCNRADIDRAWEALKPARRPRIHTFMSTGPLHMKFKLQMEPEAVHQAIVDNVGHARNLCDDVEFSPEDGSRTERDFLCRVVESAIKAGAATINIPDTVGYAVPEEFAALIAMLFDRVPNIDKATVSVHCHNDLGLAVANSLAAVAAGARQVECTINGIGERAGNAAVEEIVMALRTRHDAMPYTTGVDTTQITRASHLLSAITGFSVPPNKAIVGANAFAHEAGIHQDGVLKHAQTYEIMTPESVGLHKS
ncbi:MAG: 2-isopropylmalate synthase, partial [Geminicoccales bacterium]